MATQTPSARPFLVGDPNRPVAAPPKGTPNRPSVPDAAPPAQSAPSIPWTSTPGSSHVSGYQYDGDAQLLTVAFHGGAQYRYAASPDVAKALQSARSKGSFVYHQLRGREV